MSEKDKPITGNSLEQEWLRYVDKKKKEYGGELPALGEYGWLLIAGHFANWQKEQMMKDAVEAKIYGYDDGSFELIASWLDIPNNSIYKDGDKVKIIIVKNEE